MANSRIGRCCLYGLACLVLIQCSLMISGMRIVLPLYRWRINNRHAAFLETGCLLYLNQGLEKIMFITPYTHVVRQYMQFFLVFVFYRKPFKVKWDILFQRTLRLKKSKVPMLKVPVLYTTTFSHEPSFAFLLEQQQVSFFPIYPSMLFALLNPKILQPYNLMERFYKIFYTKGPTKCLAPCF